MSYESTVFILINAPEALQFMSLKNDILETKYVGKYAKFYCPSAIFGVIWPSFPNKMWEGAFIRE